MTDGAERRAQVAREWIDEELKTMQRMRDAAWAEYEARGQDCDTLEKTREIWDRRPTHDWQESLPTASALAPLGTVSFDGCRNAEERLVRMAESWGGMVNCNEAADLLISMGISESVQTNLSSALQKEITKEENNLWEYVGPKTYRYLPYRETGGKGVNSTNGVIKNNFE